MVVREELLPCVCVWSVCVEWACVWACVWSVCVCEVGMCVGVECVCVFGAINVHNNYIQVFP